MAQEPDQIRQAIEETRQELGETVAALGEKADVKAAVGRKVEAGKEQLKASTESAKDALSELGHRAGQAIPENVRPVVTETAGQARQVTSRAADGVRRRPLPVLVALAVLVTVLGLRWELRRRRSS
jgi:hypothetical protein